LFLSGAHSQYVHPYLLNPACIAIPDPVRAAQKQKEN
jgi:hypothetical protein